MKIKGNEELLDSEYPKVAVIGSRNCSFEDRKRAEDYAQTLSKNDYIVVSGLANGIDTHVHIGAIPNPQIAVLPVIDPIYPQNNKTLAEEILDYEGLIVAPDTMHNDFNTAYLIRDKLIVEISDYVLCLGDVMKGGTAYTYGYAKGMNKLLNHGFIEALK